jgi:hypothetical protein
MWKLRRRHSPVQRRPVLGAIENLESRRPLAADAVSSLAAPESLPVAMWIERDNGDASFYSQVVSYATSQQPLAANKLLLRLADPASPDPSISTNFQLSAQSGLIAALMQLDKKGYAGQVALIPDFTSNGHAWNWTPSGVTFTAEWQKAYYWSHQANAILAQQGSRLRIGEVTIEAEASGIPADEGTLQDIRAYQRGLWPALDASAGFVASGLAHGYTNLAQMAGWTIGATAADRLLDAAYCELYNFTETVGSTTYVDAYAAGASVTNPSPAAPDTIYTLSRNAADPAATILGTPTVDDAGSTFGYFVGKHTSAGSGMPTDLSRTYLIFSVEKSSVGNGLIDAFGTWDAPVGAPGGGVDDFLRVADAFTDPSASASFMSFWGATAAPNICVFQYEFLPQTWTVGLPGSADTSAPSTLDDFGFTLWDYRECSTDATSLAKYHTWLLTYLAAHPPGKLVLYVTDPAVAQNAFYDPTAAAAFAADGTPTNFVGFLERASRLAKRVPIEILIDRSSFPKPAQGPVPTPALRGWTPLADEGSDPIALPDDWANLPYAFSWLSTLVANASVPAGTISGLTIDPELDKSATGLTGEEAYQHVACWIDRAKRLSPRTTGLDLGMALEVDASYFAKVNTMTFPVVGAPTNGMPAFIGSWLDGFLDKTDPNAVFPRWRQPGDMAPILSMAYMETYVGGAPDAFSYFRWMNTLSGSTVVPQPAAEAAADLQRSLLDRPYATGAGTITVDTSAMTIIGTGTNFEQLVQYDAITATAAPGKVWKVQDATPANPTLTVTGSTTAVSTPSGWEFTELPMNWQAPAVPAGVENRICFVFSAEHDVAGGLPFFGYWQLPDFVSFMNTTRTLLATATPADAIFVNAVDADGDPTEGRGVPHSGYGLYSLKQICDAWGIAVYPDCVVPAAPGVALGNDTGTSETDRVTSDGRLVIAAELGARIEYSRDGGRTWAGSFTARAGVNAVAVRQIDVAGNVSPATEFVFVLDRSRPAVPTVRLVRDTGRSATDRITREGALRAAGVGADAVLEYSVDAGRTWATTFTAREGANVVHVRQTDVAGNVSAASRPYRFTLDTIAPTPIVSLLHDTGSSGGDAITQDGRLRIRGIEPGAWRRYSIDGGATWQRSFRAVRGGNMVRVRQVDVAGNVSLPAVVQFTLERP